MFRVFRGLSVSLSLPVNFGTQRTSRRKANQRFSFPVWRAFGHIQEAKDVQTHSRYLCAHLLNRSLFARKRADSFGQRCYSNKSSRKQEGKQPQIEPRVLTTEEFESVLTAASPAPQPLPTISQRGQSEEKK